MYENISNNIDTNIFEPKNGTLNIAPIKLSGQYKLVIDNNGNFYLDDYNSRRVSIDKSQSFLPQVANFLMLSSTLDDYDKLKYGAFNTSKVKSYHIPVHIFDAETLPKYFVLNLVENKTFTNPDDLYSNSRIVKFVDLTTIGLTNIFNEILNFNCKPVFFDFDDSLIKIEGFDIVNLSKGNESFSILNNQANQTYFEVLNNKIINMFGQSGLIIPNFLNIEFEYIYDTTDYKFYNFFGFLSNRNDITLDEYSSNAINVNLFEYSDRTNHIQVRAANPEIDIPFDDLLVTTTISNISNQLPQTRISLSNISVEDYVRIIHPDGTVFYEYIIQPIDIKPTFVETIRLLCSKLQALSNLNILYQPIFDIINNQTFATITIKLNVDDDYGNEYSLEVPNWFKATDSTYQFKQITDREIKFLSNIDIEISKIVIDGTTYDIVDKFIFNGDNIISLSADPNIQIQGSGEFYVQKLSKLVNLKPIVYYSVNSNLRSNLQFEKAKYIDELRKKFIEDRPDTDHPRYIEFLEAATNAINIFEESNISNDYHQYVKEIEIPKNIYETQTVNDSSDEVITKPQHNKENIKTMMFSDYGSTSYLTPNVLNIDKQFYDINGNIDYIKLDTDPIRFHWFLIKSETPEYLANDIRSLRYFEDQPKITSNLYLVANNSDFCETTFLGVKYRLPRKYSDYKFAVYLDYQNEKFIETTYKFDVDNVNKTLYLVIYKFLDFIDLLRGGNLELQPFIDLSFFYNVQQSHNTVSEALYSFKSGGVLFCDDEIPVMFNSSILNDWKYYDANSNKWYICLKRSSSVITSIFTEIFPESGDFEFFVYSSVEIEDVVYNYVAMKFEIKNIQLVADNFVWFEDIFVNFFDTNNLFLKDEDDEFVNIPPENIMSIVPLDDNHYSQYESIATILYDSTATPFKIITPNTPFSIKEYFFEFGKNIAYNAVSQVPTVTDYAFTFDEYYAGQNLPLEYFTDLFGVDSFDNVTVNQKVTLFERNQLWRLIKDILQVDVRFKHSTVSQTKKLINELLLNNLADYSDLRSIPTNTGNFIKLSIVPNDVNLAIWKSYSDIKPPEDKVFKINRYKGYYYPLLMKVNSELEFQVNQGVNEIIHQDTIFNIYDLNFGGQMSNGSAIVATGIWTEVHNVVSSIFCKTDNIELEFNISDLPGNLQQTDVLFSYQTALEEQIPFEDIIINNNNSEYLSSTNNNIDEYIKETFIRYMLSNFYHIVDVKNELGQKLYFEEHDDFNLLLKSIKSYQTRFNKLIIIFKRK